MFNLKESRSLINDVNFDTFVDAYQSIIMREFINIDRYENINDKLYIDFMKKKTKFLDDIMNQIVLVFIKKQVSIILQNQSQITNVICELINEERNRISKNEFIKSALERNQAFKIIERAEIEQFLTNMTANKDIIENVLKTLQLLKPESAILNNFVYLRIREKFFSADTNKIKSFVSEELQVLCQGIGPCLKYFEKNITVSILTFIRYKNTLINIYKALITKISASKYKVDHLNITAFKQEIVLLEKKSIKEDNLVYYEKRVFNVIKQHDIIIKIIEYTKKLAGLIEKMKKQEKIYNKSIQKLVLLLVNKLENFIVGLKDINVEHDFVKLEAQISIIQDFITLFVKCDELLYLVNSRVICNLRQILKPEELIIESENPKKSQNNLYDSSNVRTNELSGSEICNNSERDLFKELDVVIEYINFDKNQILNKLIFHISETAAFYTEFKEKISYAFRFQLNFYKMISNTIEEIDDKEKEKMSKQLEIRDLAHDFSSNNILHSLQREDIIQKFIKFRKDGVCVLTYFIITPIKRIINDIKTLFGLKVDDKHCIKHLVKIIKYRLENKNDIFDDRDNGTNENKNDLHTIIENLTKLFIYANDKQILEKVLSIINNSIICEPILKWLNIVNEVDDTIKSICDIDKFSDKGYIKIFDEALLALDNVKFGFKTEKDIKEVIINMNFKLQSIIDRNISKKKNLK